MKRNNLILLIILVAILTSISAFIYLDNYNIIEVRRFPMDVTVDNTGVVGINVDPDGFHFGTLNYGQGVRRELIIKQLEEDTRFEIRKKGEIASWVSNPNNFVLKKGEARNISFSINIPYGAAIGNYTGEVVIILRRA